MRAPGRLVRILIGFLTLTVAGIGGPVPTLAQGPDDGGTGSTQSEPSVDLPGYLEHYSRGFRVDTRELAFTQKYFWHRLFRPSDRDRALGTALFVGAMSLAIEKQNIAEEVQESNTPERKNFFRGVQTLGGQGVVPGIALLFYVGGSTFGDYRAKQTGAMLAQSALFTAILTGAGQVVLNEDRPKDGGHMHPLQGKGHGVSGHTSTAASMAGVLSRMYLQVDADDGRVARTFKRIGKGLAYGVPMLVGFARVNENQHFAYSSVLGAGIGFWAGNVVADAHEIYLEAPRPRWWKPKAVGPITDDQGAPGLGARWEF
jgi:membrane-associated phospholipid phosphatase